MNSLERRLGMDLVDVGIQGVITALAVAAIDSVIHGPVADLLTFKVIGLSILLFAWRRHRGLRRLREQGIGLESGELAAARLEDVEQRLTDLEAAQSRVAELEERLDFAERLLARPQDEAYLPAKREPRDG